ncbi:MAG: Major Facilitator Superfamily protein (modular protein) [Promethearchaeota archaeon]|nr:MAG: Major Facilitator Superfamily protein (modular protein) [Candidatus Lokiarchaeota archaeon]
MNKETSMKLEKNFKTSYTRIFAIIYFIQGISLSLFTTVIPIYLILQLEALEATGISTLCTIVLLPFAVKFIYGLLSDKYHFKRIGRRKPWIIGASILAGTTWLFLPFLVTEFNPLIAYMIGGLIISVGMAISDTAIDGMILDNCPKEQLGRVQGICWGFRSVGMILGGPLVVAVYILIGINIEIIFISYGFIVISTCFLVLIVEESFIINEINLIENLKTVFGKKKNWTVFSFAFFNAFVDGVIFLFVSLFILFQTGDLTFQGGTINTSAIEENKYLYGSNAFISFIIGAGVIMGAIVGGYIADFKSRKGSFYTALIVTTVSLIVFIIPAPFWLLLIFAFFIGSSNGLRISGFSAIVGQISKLYPEIDSTYYATCNSFQNIGTQLGLISINIILVLSSQLSYYTTFLIIFIFLAMASNIGIIPFLFLNSEEYELPKSYKENILKEKKVLNKSAEALD